MEAAAIKVCSRCGRTGIGGDVCPDCGAPTYTPAGMAPVRSARADPGAPLLVALAGAALVIGSLFLTWYHLRIPPEAQGLFTDLGNRLGSSFDQIAPGVSSQINQGVGEVIRNGIDIS